MVGRSDDGSRELFHYSLIASSLKAAVKKALDFANDVWRHCASVILFND